MVNVIKERCNGCGVCVDVCPEQAITIRDDDLAIVNEDLCTQCGACINVCPTGAIRELVSANIKLSKGGETMQYGYGRGFGFRGSSPPWPYVGRGRGGLSRCSYPGMQEAASYPPPVPYQSPQTREKEISFLKQQADMIKQEMGNIERRIKELEQK